MLEYIILGTLYEKTLTGYEIRKCIEDGIGMFYKASYGSIYPILQKLLEKEMVSYVDEVKGKRVKKRYQITKTGEITFENWLKEDCNGAVEVFMAKVFFFDHLPEPIASKEINTYRERLLTYRNELIKKKKEFDDLKDRQKYYYKLSTLYYGIYKLEAVIRWCEMLMERKQLENAIERGNEDAGSNLDRSKGC